jgi:hypothetical protein
MSLRLDIKNWNGQSTEVLQAIFVQYRQDERFIEDILICMNDSQFQIASSWLLKVYVESAGVLTTEQVEPILKGLPSYKDWQTVLHILQSFNYLRITDSVKNKVAAFLQHNLTHQNKFVRAWVYNSFYVLSQQHQEYQKEARAFLSQALQDEAPSVKARIRNIIKQANFN